MATPKTGSVDYAKAIIRAALQAEIIKPKTTVEDLLRIMPSSGDNTVEGGVLAWSGYCFVYPKLAANKE
jgi:hypothetical protein